MKKWLGITLLYVWLSLDAAAGQPDKMQLIPPKQTLEVLKSIEDHAIVFGNGKEPIYTFIDPYCELSQRYLSFIFKQKERMFSKYTFYFFLYELKGKNSAAMITSILSSEFKETMLTSVMLDHQDVPMEDDADAEEAVEAIAKAADTIGVFKRPYILINGKVK